jgi:rhamnosyltransferase
MDVVGEVIWYNPTKKDKDNIKTYLPFLKELYIIDNSINENTIPINSSKITYIHYSENIGVPKAMNLIAKRAFKDGYKWMLTMDQDTEMNDKCYQKFLHVINNMDTSIIGIITPWHDTKLGEERPNTEYDFPLDVMTSGNFVNLKILTEIGYYNEKFFIDGIDIEYGLRLNKNGYSIVRCNDVTIKHNLGNIKLHYVFGKKYVCTNHNYLRQYYMARNYRYIKEEYYSFLPDYCEKLIKIKGIIFKILFFEHDKIRKIVYMIKGISDYRKGIYGKIKEF